MDPTRILHRVVTGVGFLGAGSIVHQEGFVHGFTTAASLWIVAAIGVVVGCRAFARTATGTVLALVVPKSYRWIGRVLAPGGENGD